MNTFMYNVENGQIYFKNLAYSNRKVLKVCLAILVLQNTTNEGRTLMRNALLLVIERTGGGVKQV